MDCPTNRKVFTIPRVFSINSLVSVVSIWGNHRDILASVLFPLSTIYIFRLDLRYPISTGVRTPLVLPFPGDSCTEQEHILNQTSVVSTGISPVHPLPRFPVGVAAFHPVQTTSPRSPRNDGASVSASLAPRGSGERFWPVPGVPGCSAAAVTRLEARRSAGRGVGRRIPPPLSARGREEGAGPAAQLAAETAG